jgi:hypothetical protein
VLILQLQGYDATIHLLRIFKKIAAAGARRMMCEVRHCITAHACVPAACVQLLVRGLGIVLQLYKPEVAVFVF